jgi:hypothetical protein
MKTIVSTIHIADEGKLFVRKADGKIFGRRLVLGKDSTIDMFEEKEFTAEEIAELDRKFLPNSPEKRVIPHIIKEG